MEVGFFMSRKKRFTKEQKIKACEEYLAGLKSATQIGIELEISKNSKYDQLYQWVRKYETNGENALIDKRGKHKLDEELSDLEKADRKIAKLEREKQEYQRKYELLKKAEEIERW